MEEYRIELLDPAQFNKLIPLMQDSFGVSVDVNYFRWKFLDNPAGQFIGFVAISSTGEYASYYGVIPELYQFENNQRIIYQSCDTMTHSGHRRKGLFQKLATECYNYLRNQNKLFVIGFGGGQSTPGFIKFGWKKIFDIHYIFRPRIHSSINHFFRHLRPKAKFEIVDSQTHSDLIRLKNLTHSRVVTQVFNESFINWRLSNPKIKYLIKYVKEIKINKIVGYLIYYKHQDKIILFDLFSQSNGAITSMISFLDEICIEQKCKGIITISQLNIMFADVLIKNGFWINPWNRGPLHEKIPFIFYANESEINRYNEPKQWQITPFCNDAF